MKIKGIEINARYRTVITFKRPSGNISFTLEAVNDYADFDQICPRPSAPWIQKAGEEKSIQSFDDPAYKKQIEEYSEHKISWMILKTMAPSEVEWSTVDLRDPKTYNNWVADMTAAGFTNAEINKLQNQIFTANGLGAAEIEVVEGNF